MTLAGAGGAGYPGRAMDRLRLFLSYQRYAFALLFGPGLVVAGVAAAGPGAWWAWGPLTLLALWLGSFGVVVWRRFPKKLRATLVADRRIAQHRFRPDSVLKYCGDPCYRVVAHEILARAGLGRSERRALVRKLTALEAERATQLVLVNRVDGYLVHIDGGQITRQEIPCPES